MTAPLVVALDVNETLSDLTPLRRRLASVGAPGHLLDLWFASTLRDGFALAAVDAYAPFAEVGTGVLRAMLARDSAVEADPREAAAHVMAGFAQLEVHKDVPAGLRRLVDGGVRVVTLTNGSAEQTDGLLRRAGVADLVEHQLSVDDVRRWKPAPEPYLHAADVCGVRPEEVALVAVHPWDVDGARRAGLQAGYLARHGGQFPGFFLQPTVRAGTLSEVAGALLAL